MHTYHNHHHATSGTMTCGKQICSSPQCFTTIQTLHKWETHHLFIFQRALPGISPNRFPHPEFFFDCDGISLQGVAHTVSAVTDTSFNGNWPKWIPTESSSGILHHFSPGLICLFVICSLTHLPKCVPTRVKRRYLTPIRSSSTSLPSLTSQSKYQKYQHISKWIPTESSSGI